MDSKDNTVPTVSPKRMGHAIDLQGKKVTDLSPKEFHNQISTKIWEHGVICIKHQEKLTAEDLIEATTRLGQIVRLPQQLAFNNKDHDFPEITRVGNINNAGEIMTKYFGAEYWHTDGSFWPEGKNFVLNWLHSKIKPEKGGQTAFIDMREIYAQLSEEQKQKYLKAKFTSKHRNLQKDSKNSEAEKLGVPPSTTHAAVLKHHITGEPALYIGTGNCFLIYEDGTEEKVEGVIADLAEKFPVYVHEWEDGDLLVWDNTQLMHRGLGGIGNSARLLFRTQSRVTQYYIDLYNEFTK